jgi:hypothetical protein
VKVLDAQDPPTVIEPVDRRRAFSPVLARHETTHALGDATGHGDRLIDVVVDEQLLGLEVDEHERNDDRYDTEAGQDYAPPPSGSRRDGHMKIVSQTG